MTRTFFDFRFLAIRTINFLEKTSKRLAVFFNRISRATSPFQVKELKSISFYYQRWPLYVVYLILNIRINCYLLNLLKNKQKQRKLRILNPVLSS